MHGRGRARTGWVAVAAAGAALAVPGMASAAVSEPRVGEQSDPAADATLAYSDSGGGATRLLEVTRVKVDYDSRSGELNVRFEGDGLSNTTHSGIGFHAVLSAPNASGRCDGAVRDGDLRVQAGGGLGYDATEPAYLTDASGATVVEGFTEWPGDGSRPRIAFKSPVLQSRDLRCVSGVSAERGVSGYLNSSRDVVADFCLAGCPQLDAPENLRASGSTLSWKAVGTQTSYVVATSTAAEGAAGRTTTYKTVTGTSYTPPAVAVAGATRHYSVRANVTGGRWARPEVAIAYATAAPAISRSGNTVSWTKVGSFTSYVLATSTAAEGTAGRTTTYRTVTGLSTTPPAVPGTTRYYGVRANVAGSAWAEPEVAIAYR